MLVVIPVSQDHQPNVQLVLKIITLLLMIPLIAWRRVRRCLVHLTILVVILSVMV